MEFNEIRKWDQRLADAAPPIEELNLALKGGHFETTGEVMASLLKSLDALKNGILDVAESGNAYAFKAMFRVFLEHLLKMLAIYSSRGQE